MRRIIIVSLIVFSIIATAQQWRSVLYPENWQPATPDSEGRFLHDFSYAGYHAGMKEIPIIKINIVDVTKKPYKADNKGNKDVTSILQKAIKDVEKAGGGVVYLPKGMYKVSVGENDKSALRITQNNVVLRGAGMDKTFIKNTTTNMRNKFLILVSPEYGAWQNNIANTGVRIVSDLLLPTTTIPVENVKGLKVGDEILLGSECTAGFVEEHNCTNIWASLEDVAAGRAKFALRGPRFMRTITAIDAAKNIVEIDVPTRYFLKTRDNSRVWKAGAQITECGIENLSIGNVQNSKTEDWDDDGAFNRAGKGAYEVHSSYIVVVQNAKNCWMKQVGSFRPQENQDDFHVLSNFLSLRDCRQVTVSKCNFQKSQYEGGGGNGYMYTLEGNDCLLDQCHAQDGRHNYDFKNMSSNGNVIYKCTSKDPRYSTDYHMYLSMSNLIDSFVSDGDYLEAYYRPYGQSGTPPLNFHAYPTTQSVYWNIKGIKKHAERDYLLWTQQYKWGYIIGTSGACSNVKTTPVEDEASYGGATLKFDSGPEDFTEGIGKGETLVPQSLYMDQLTKRKSRENIK